MGSPSLDMLNLYVRRIVAKGSGISGKKVVPTDSNHPAPNGLYATVKDISNIGEGVDAHTYRDGTGTSVDIGHHGNRITTFSVQFYRDGANEASKSLRMWLYSVLGQDALEAVGLSLRRVGETRDLNAIFDRDSEPRTSMDIEFGYVENLTQNVNSIDKTDISVIYSEMAEEVI